MEGRTFETGDVLAIMATAMPDSFKQAIRDDLKDDPYAALLDDERTFAKLWDVFTPQDKQHYADLAGLDPAALQTLAQNLAAIAGKDDGAKKSFNTRAHEDGTDHTIYEPPTASGEEEPGAGVHITGRRPDPSEETEEQARIRRKKYLDALQALEEEETRNREETQAAENKAGKDSAPENAAAQGEGDQKFASSHLGLYRIRDHGDYLTIQGKGDRAPPRGHRAITEQQMRMALIVAILDKGMSDIQIYRGHKIDSQLTSQARGMLAGDAFLHRVLGAKAATPILTQMQKDPPCWCRSGLGHWLHERHYNAQERGNKAAEKQSMKDGRKIAGNFTDAAGQTLSDRVSSKKQSPAASSSPVMP